MPSDRSGSTRGVVGSRRDEAAAARLLMVLLACLVASFLGNPAQAPKTSGDRQDRATTSVWIAGEPFSLWIATDESSRYAGLAGVAEIPEHGGMMFVYPSERLRRYYMAGCLVDIDLIFLNSAGEIVALHEMKAQPARRTGESEAGYSRRLPRYHSLRPARYAIELKAGSIDRLGLVVGQRIELDVPQ